MAALDAGLSPTGASSTPAYLHALRTASAGAASPVGRGGQADPLAKLLAAEAEAREQQVSSH
jgi:hypothetical protein